MKRLLVLTLVLLALPLRAEDWKTIDGKVYVDVQVIKIEDDAVTIMCKDGGGLVPLVNLPPELRKRFNFDPARAEVAAKARAIADAENAKRLQAEIDAAAKKKQQDLLDAEKERAGTATKP